MKREITKNNGGSAIFQGRNASTKRHRPLSILALFLIIAGAWLIAASTVQAMPPYTGNIGDGLSKGNSHKFDNSYYLNHLAEIYARGVNNPGDALAGNSGDIPGLAKASWSGNINILTILVDFSDKKAGTSDLFFDTLIYVNQTGTVTNYYREVSYNTLTITTIELPSDLGWKGAPQTYAYYVDGQNGFGSYPQNAQKLVEDAVDAVDPYVNFSQYDNNSDGYVDGLIVVHAGRGAEFSGSDDDIWSHKWSISPRLKDGVYIYNYSMQPEYWSSPGDMTCGVYCHELGHVFGLPDLYDTDYSSAGIGNWSLMAGGSWNGSLGNSPAHPDAWCRIQLGFVTPTVLSLDQTNVSLPSIESSQTIYKLWTNGLPGSEYFLVANRQQSGYDTYIPGNGLLIWHIDETKSTNTSEWWPGSGASSHYKVALVQADSLWQMEHNYNSGNSGDPYPGSTGNRLLNSTSSPNSKNYADANTNVSVGNISNSGSTMTADIAVGLPQAIEDNKYVIPDQAALYRNYPNPFNAATSINFTLLKSADISIDIFDVTGQFVDQIFAGYLEAGIHNIDWNGRNSQNHNLASGVYLYRLSIGTSSACRKMLYLK